MDFSGGMDAPQSPLEVALEKRLNEVGVPFGTR